ncbi:MAG TPA: ABC transporter ATP-binding protein [Micromonosporaceae bacterium]|jgi:ABC-2 type transport system ATP-binding protein
MIVTRALTKRFGSVTAVNGVDLDVREGDRYGLLGPNGSGKTTLIRLILGLSFATSGSIELLGESMPRHGKRVLPEVGALIEAPAGYPHLSGRTNLMLFDAAGGGRGRKTRRDRVERVLDQVGLGGVDTRPLRAYSLGMRQRLGIAAALLTSPKLLILDEPTNGLDPRGIRDIRDLLLELTAGGITLFVSSHLLSEVEQLCTRVGVMDAGRLVLQDDLDSIRVPTGRIALETPDPTRAVALLDGRVERRDESSLLVRGDDVATLTADLVAAGVRVDRIAPELRTLETVVLEVTGSGADRIDKEAAL